MKVITLAAACLMLLTGPGAAPGAWAAAPAWAAPGRPAAPSGPAAVGVHGTLAARPLPVVYDCLGWRQGQVKAGTIALSCFGTVVVKIAAWRYWTGVSARSAVATLGVDQCLPNCGTGKFRKYAATVVLYRVRDHDRVAYYSRLRVQYRHGGPRSYTFRWARYPGATLPVWVGGPSSSGRPTALPWQRHVVTAGNGASRRDGPARSAAKRRESRPVRGRQFS
ncbi:MAG TPA: hypothetical protein VIJ82_31910 [Streptosporangiaceae bacterium]|jgi:hypothetical protein